MTVTFVRSIHRSKNVPGIGLINVFRINTGGVHYPGLVRKHMPAGPIPAGNTDFKTPLEMVELYGTDFIANASGWDTTTSEVRGPGIMDGVAYSELSTSHPQKNGAVAYCEDGQLRYYEAALGDTAADMIADGAIHSWSWGPRLIADDGLFDYMSSGGWGALNRSAKSARTVLAQSVNGDLVVYQAYGVSYASGATVDEMAAALVGEGLRIAVLLDGGGSVQSAWSGKIAHVTSDTASRRIPDAIGFCAPAANVMRIPATQLALHAPYTGTVNCSLVDGTVYIVGTASGANTAPGSSQVTEAGALPMYVRHPRPTGAGRAGGGKTVIPAIRSGILYATNGYSDGANSPDIYMEFNATYGMG